LIERLASILQTGVTDSAYQDVTAAAAAVAAVVVAFDTVTFRGCSYNTSLMADIKLFVILLMLMASMICVCLAETSFGQ